MTFSLRNCVAASALATLALVGGAQAQAQKPNILVIMGDDIGYWNISAYNRGMMGYRTPNIDRIAKEGGDLHRLLRPAILHRRPRRLHHRPEPDPHRIAQGRPAVGEGGPVGQGPDAGRIAQAPGLRDRPVRQEPSRRPQRIPADRPRLRRVLRQPLSPQRRGGAGEPGLSQGRRLSELRQEVRPARRPEVRGDRRPRLPAKTRVSERGASRNRGHRPADEEAHGDRGRGVPRRLAQFHRPRAQGQQAVLRLVQLDPDAHLHPSQAGVGQGKTGLGVDADGMVEHDGMVGQLLKKLDDLGIADNTIVMYTTDNGAESFSWPDGGTTPFRSEKNANWEGGYRVPGDGPLARRDQAGYRDQRHRLARRLGADAGGGRRRAGRDGEAAHRLRRRRARRSRSISTATTSTISLPAVRPSARSSSTGPTTATSPGCATTNGSSCSWSSSTKASKSGRSRSSRCARRCSSTCAPTRSKRPRRSRANTRSGMSSACSCWCRRRRSWRALADVQGLPAAPEAGQLLGRRRPGQAPERPAQQQLTDTRAAVRLSFGGSICLVPCCGEFGCLPSSEQRSASLA